MGPPPDGSEPDVAQDSTTDLGPGAEMGVDVSSLDAPGSGADAEAPAPKDESVYGCPCNVGRGSGSPPSWLAILGLALVFRRRTRGVPR